MLVPLTVFVPQDVANLLQSTASNASSKVFKIIFAASQAQQISPQVQRDQPVYQFTPTLLGGKTASQLFSEDEDQQRRLNQMMMFDIDRQDNTRQHNVKRNQKPNRSISKNAQTKSRKPKRMPKQQKTARNRNVAKPFVPRLLGKRTASQLFFMYEFQINSSRNQAIQQQTAAKGNQQSTAFAPRLLGQRTPSQLFFMNRFQAIKSAPSSGVQIIKNPAFTAIQSKNQKPKANVEFVPRLLGQRTPSQLFRVSKILDRKANLQYGKKVSRPASRHIPRLFGKRTPSQLFFISKITQKKEQTRDKRHQNKTQAKNSAPFVPSLFGEKTPSQLHETSGSKIQTKSNASARQAAKRQYRMYDTTLKNGYLTVSRLISPYRIKREKYFTLGRKDRMTPSALHLAYAKTHKFRAALFGGHTASQLFKVADRARQRSEANQQFDLMAGFPTVSQLGLNRRSSKPKVRAVQHHAPLSKLLKHMNQLPMEKNRKLDEALSGLTASQLLVLSNSTKSRPLTSSKKNTKTSKQPESHFSKKYEVAEKSGLMPFLFGI